MKANTALLLIAFCICPAARAKSPFDGTWRVNTAKSQPPTVTFSLQEAGADALKYSDSNESYTVRLDGSPSTTPLGEEVAMHPTGDSSYSFTTKRKGKLLTDERWKLSINGNTLTIRWKTFQPNGRIYHSDEVDERTSPGRGLVGTWKIKRITTDLRDALVIQTAGRDDVTLTASIGKTTVHAKWDGRDYPAEGLLAPSGLTVALTKTASREFKEIIKVKGKIGRIQYYKFAADGRTMVVDGTNAEGKQPSRQFFEKQ